MAGNQTPIVDRIRIIPRSTEFLNRNIGSSGEVFFDKQFNTLRIFSGKDTGGSSVVTNLNINQNLLDSGVAVVEYTVTVGVDPDEIESGNKYFIDNTYKPTLNFVTGYTYVFNQNDSTNEFYPNESETTPNPHPLSFSSDNADGILGDGTAYINNVIYKLNNLIVTRDEYISNFNTASQRSVQITITSSTPTTLYYWCNYHTEMGNTIAVANPGSGSGGGTALTVSDTAPASPTHGSIWYNSSNASLYVYITDVDSSQWVQPASGNLNIPETLTDLGISDGTNGQVLTTDGAGNFSFTTVESGSGSGVIPGNSYQINIIGSDSSLLVDSDNNKLTGNLETNNITSSDSSAITVVPAVIMNSDLTVENDLRVTNTAYAENFTSTGTGLPVIDSASTLTLSAPDGVLVKNGILRMPSFTSSERDNLTAQNGDIIYNSTTNKFQGYENGSWANLI